MAATLTVRTATNEPRPQLPAIRIRPVPRLEPPTEEAPPTDVAMPGGGWEPSRQAAPTLPIDFGPPATGVTGPATTQAAAPQAGLPEGSVTEPSRPSMAPLVARRFVAACLEVIEGYRPVTHLRPLCTPERFEHVVRLLTGRALTAAPSRTLGASRIMARTPIAGRPRTGAPPRHGRAEQTSHGDRIAIRKIQVGEPLEGVAEVAVVLTRQERVWAMALRLEERNGRWVCSALDVL